MPMGLSSCTISFATAASGPPDGAYMLVTIVGGICPGFCSRARSSRPRASSTLGAGAADGAVAYPGMLRGQHRTRRRGHRGAAGCIAMACRSSVAAIARRTSAYWNISPGLVSRNSRCTSSPEMTSSVDPGAPPASARPHVVGEPLPTARSSVPAATCVTASAGDTPSRIRTSSGPPRTPSADVS